VNEGPDVSHVGVPGAVQSALVLQNCAQADDVELTGSHIVPATQSRFVVQALLAGTVPAAWQLVYAAVPIVMTMQPWPTGQVFGEGSHASMQNASWGIAVPLFSA
jgi:hypothetical protein